MWYDIVNIQCLFQVMNSKTNFQLPKITVDCKLDDNEIKLKLPPMSSAFKQDFSGISLSSSGQNNWTERHLVSLILLLEDTSYVLGIHVTFN